jgi:hypothetical protein
MKFKREIFQNLSKIQRSHLISFLKKFILKKKSMDKVFLCEEFVEEQRYYIEIAQPYFSFMEEVIDDDNFLKDLKICIGDLLFKQEQKEALKPLREKQKEFAKQQRKRAQQIKMSFEKPSSKQLYYYKSLCKKYNQEPVDIQNLSKLDLSNMIQKLIEKNPDSDTI